MNIFSNSKYITFFQEFIKILNTQSKNLIEEDKFTLKQILQADLDQLTKDINFIVYINDKLIIFLQILRSIPEEFLSKRIFYRLIQNIIEISPLAMFQKNLPAIGQQTFKYLTEYYKDSELIIEYITNYTTYFSHSSQPLQNNQSLLQKAADILFDAKQWIDHQSINPSLLIPLKKEIGAFLIQWYLSGQLPEHDFDIHKRLIYNWVDFVNLRPKLEEMMNILYIKDLIWAVSKFDLNGFNQKYKELPESIFIKNGNILIQELLLGLKINFSDLNQFLVFHQIFTIFQEDYEKFKLNPIYFKEIVEIFNSTFQNSMINLIKVGQTQRFDEIFTKLDLDIIFISMKILNEFYENFIIIHEMHIKEGERFNSRIQMMKITIRAIQNLIDNYEIQKQIKSKFLGSEYEFISLDQLKEYIIKLKDGSYTIFQETQKWLIQISTTDYLTYDLTFKPIKILFSNIIDQFSNSKSDIITELTELSKEIFRNQKILNDNKKKFFKMMIEIISPDLDRNFNIQLNEWSEFVEELSDIESIYYTIKDNDPNKVETVKKRAFKIISKFPHLFSPWFIYANCLTIQEKYHDAINAYYEALKYESNQGNFARLYHNLLVAFLSQKKHTEAIALVKKLDVGIKTYPHIIELIHKIEELTGQRLVGE